MNNNDKKELENAITKVFKDDNDKPKTEGGSSFAQQIKQKYGFHAMHNRIMSSIMSMVVSWILSCFDKYSEYEFHEKMKQQFNYIDKFTGAVYPMVGFDFIDDWSKNHKNTLDKIFPLIKKMNVPINRQELHGLTLAAIRKHGWIITQNESECFRFTINRLYNILYFNIDSIAQLR